MGGREGKVVKRRLALLVLFLKSRSIYLLEKPQWCEGASHTHGHAMLYLSFLLSPSFKEEKREDEDEVWVVLACRDIAMDHALEKFEKNRP